MKKSILPPSLMMALCIGAMWALVDLVPTLTFGFSGQGLIGTFLVAAGLGVNVNAMIAFAKADTTINPLTPEKTSSLVTHGLFAQTRNPIYLAMAMILLGVFILFGNLINVAAVIFFVWYITNFQIIPEEEALKVSFGATYEDYCKKVRRWI